ncbi:MAG TPA: hypothetical protein VI566_13380 [Xanthomonadales bacterium]|nr:hypothetical protein [Xanthomonadales bacterium]
MHGRSLLSRPALSLQGHRLIVRARHYVLACGAIENARLLLLSDEVVPGGIGNAHDQVGRYFMEHPHSRIAHVETQDPGGFWALYRKRFFAMLHPLRRPWHTAWRITSTACC